MEILFEKYITEHKLFSKKDKILAALSGGADSVALVNLLIKTGYNIIIAHCNFKLRGSDSDNDEIFCRNIAQNLNVPFFVTKFETTEIAKKNKTSVEETARNLRYNWFEKIRIQNNCKYIATAHHLNDNIETVLMKFTSGTGIKGLAGIKNKNKKIVRPLIFAKKHEIENYCINNNLKFRTDESNFDTKIKRNNFRLNIVPLFKNVNPNFENTFTKNIEIITDIEKIYKKQVKKKQKKIVKKTENKIYINIKKLLKTEAPKTYLFEFIKKYGFASADINNIFSALTEQPGKKFLSPKYILIKDRKNLIIGKPKKIPVDLKIENIENIPDEFAYKFEIIKISDKPDFKKKQNNTAFVDADKISWPIFVRNFCEGDYFYPLGMGGRKNLSDFFTDKKLNLLEKHEILIFTSGNNIFWIAELQIDNRFKITENTKTILKISPK